MSMLNQKGEIPSLFPMIPTLTSQRLSPIPSLTHRAVKDIKILRTVPNSGLFPKEAVNLRAPKLGLAARAEKPAILDAV